MYKLESYFDNKLNGLEDNYMTNDFEDAKLWAHAKLMQGNNVKITNVTTGIEKEILSDEYYDKWEENNGEFTSSYEDFEKGA